jgi:hypothetical protein
MTGDPMFYVFIINSLIVALAVMVHYEFLYRITLYMPNMPIKHRLRIVAGVFSALVAHAFEVWIFACAYYLMEHTAGWGQLTGNIGSSLMDCAYFSFTVFTTLGFGDIVPIGHLRYLTGIESLTGMVLITWTASFLFMEMQRHWTLRG